MLRVSMGWPDGTPMDHQHVWLTLTDLGRRFGVSAVACGKLLSEAGLRDPQGHPNDVALDGGYAYSRPDPNAHHSPLWHQERCSELLLGLGLNAVADQQLILQWADLLAALEEGSPSITTSPAQMAEELPTHLVPAVNARLQLLGCGFQLNQLKTEARDSSDSRTAAS